jgi:hypothetical protein
MILVITTWVNRYPTIAFVGIAVCAVFALISFFQWRKRYMNNFSDIHEAYLVITDFKNKPNDIKPSTKDKKAEKKIPSNKPSSLKP